MSNNSSNSSNQIDANMDLDFDHDLPARPNARQIMIELEENDDYNEPNMDLPRVPVNNDVRANLDNDILKIPIETLDNLLKLTPLIWGGTAMIALTHLNDPEHQIISVVICIGNIPNKAELKNIIEFLMAKWQGITGQIEVIPYTLIIQFKTKSFNHTMFKEFRRTYPNAYLLVTNNSKQRELGAISFGLSAVAICSEVFSAIQREIDNKKLPFPSCITISTARASKACFGIIVWISPQDMFKFYGKASHMLFAGNISFKLSPKWDELNNVSDLYQIHHFQAVQLLDLDELLLSCQIPNSDYIAKLNSRGYVDHVLVFITEEKFSQTLDLLKAAMPLAIMAKVTPERCISEKLTID